MSIQYCFNCDRHIDTDYDVEHFDECKPSEWQEKFEKMMETADRIVKRGKLIKEMENKK